MAGQTRSKIPHGTLTRLLVSGSLLLTLSAIVTAVSNPALMQDLRTRALGLPQFPVTVSPMYRAPGQKWTITYTGANKSSMTTQLQVKTRNCDLYNPGDCTAWQIVSPWTWPSGGGPRVMTGGVLTSDTPANIPSERVYYVAFRPLSFITQYDFSKTFATVVTNLPQQYTDNDILNSYQTLVNRQLSTYPYLTTPGLPFTSGSTTYTTISQVQSSSLTPDAKVDFMGRLICGDTILKEYNSNWTQAQLNDWLERFATLRKCYAASFSSLAEIMMWPYMQNPGQTMPADQKDTLTRLFYYILLQHDIMAARPSLNEQPFTQLRTTMPNGLRLNWQLGDTRQSLTYLTDDMPVYKSMGYGQKMGLINRYFCSYVESSSPSTCVQIDLYKRFRDISQRIYNDKVIHDGWFNRLNWDIGDWGHQAIWQTTGVALAARMNSTLTSYTANSNTKTKDILYKSTNTIAMHQLGLRLGSNIVENGGQADLYQRYTNMLLIENWRTLKAGDPFYDRGTQLFQLFQKSFFRDGQPVFSDTQDSYIASRLPSGSIYDCHQANYLNFVRTPDGHILGTRGEPPSSAVLTSVAATRHVADSINPSLVPVIRATAMRALSAAIKDPLKGANEQCGQSQYTINPLWSTIRQSNYLIIGWNAWKKTQLGVF